MKIKAAVRQLYMMFTAAWVEKLGSVNMIGREREIKFYSGDFVVNKSYYNTLLHRQEVLAKEVSRKKVVHNTLITTNGIKRNEYSSIFTNVVTLDDLFRENR